MSRSPWYSLPDHLSRFRVRAASPSRRGFSWQHRITLFPHTRSPSALGHHQARIYLYLTLRPWTWTTIATPGYLPASPLFIRLPTTGSGPVSDAAVSPKGRCDTTDGQHHRARYGRSFAGTGISTRCPSTTPVGLALGPDLPRADEPGPGTLGHSADGILTRLSLLMPAFSLVPAPPLDHSGASLPARRSPTHPHT